MQEHDLIEPEGTTPREFVLAEMRGCGVPAADVEWLTDAVLSLVGSVPEGEGLPIRSDEYLFELVDDMRRAVVAEAFRRHPGDPDAALLFTLLRLPHAWSATLFMTGSQRVRPSGSYEQSLRALLPFWLENWRCKDASRAYLRAWQPDPVLAPLSEHEDVSIRVLLEAGLLRPGAMVDTPRIRTTDRFKWSYNPDEATPEQLEFWFERLGSGAVPLILPVLKREPEETKGALALGILTTLSRVLGPGGAREAEDHSVWAKELAPMAELLRTTLEEHRDDLPYLSAFWWCVTELARSADDCLSTAAKDAAKSSAQRELGRLREHARQAASPKDTGEYVGFGEHYSRAALCLAEIGELWTTMKSLLLVFRTLRAPGIANDLRWWGEPNMPAPPAAWRWVMEDLAGLIHGQARCEEHHDPTLTGVREALARFCLDRLRSRGKAGAALTNEQLVEPDPIWRRCYIRAVRELHVNPEARGHHTLHWLSRHDPDEQVRHAAKAGYSELRKGTRPEDGTSPRRVLFAALWWLRQAHLLALGVEIDAQGARRTRQVEARRTKPKEIATE